MKMKRHFFSLLILGISYIPNSAFSQGKVDIIAEPEVQEAEDARIEKRKAADGKVKGYRIIIGFYSNRAEAEALRSEAASYFETSYGVKILYDEPNFKVYVGEFTSSEDADEALVAVRKKYKGATRITDTIQRKKAIRK
jgi:hypothetical protein